MPINWTYIPADKLGLSVWHGVVGFDAWQLYANDLNASPDLLNMEMRLSDISRAQIELTHDQLAQAVEAYSIGASKYKKFAIVAGENFEIGRAFEKMAEKLPIDIIIFNSLPSACLWLNIDFFRVVKVVKQLGKPQE